MFISECGDGACAAEPLWCCPALLSAHEAVIWIRTNPKTCCSGFAPASPAHRLSLTLHQLGTHSPLCVCVFVCMCCGCVDALCCCLKKKKIQSLLLWNRVVSSLEATVCGPSRQLAMAVRLLRGVEDVLASGSQLVWTLAHQTFRRWYNRGLTPCRRFLEAWFGIGKCYQVRALIKPHQREFSP